MARVTVEDCLQNVSNRFALVHVAAHRARQLSHGSHRLLECDNKDIVTALREIASGKVLPKIKTAQEENEASLKIDIPDLK